ncbi:MAG: hypothetical protein WC538_19515 [Thermoanaerobaculia bacterium]|jgi:hypothetical protein
MRLVRSLFVCLLLAAFPGYAAEPVALALDLESVVPATDGDLVVPAIDLDPGAGGADVSFAETVRYHQRGQNIRGLCRAGFDVIGCTDFPAERIECTCERRGDHWVLKAHAKINAEIHLADRRSYNKVLAHERMHLVDLETELRAHLGSLVAQRFESAPGCEELARVISAPSYVRAVMNRLRRASNEKYHCQRHGSPVEAPEKPLVLARAQQP